MCVAFFTLQHADYALVLCTNRDEYLPRPTQPASFHHDVLSGIDTRAGGTWLGIHRAGRLAVLTNITEPAAPFASSRGHLVAGFLTAGSSLDAVRRLIPPDAAYAGFNLVLLAPATSTPLAFDALRVTNHGAGGPVTYRALSDERCHALSNAIDTPDADEWPKVQHGRHAFEHVLDTLAPDTPDEQLAERLFDLLSWRSAPPRSRAELKNTIEVEPLCIGDDGALYATRLSTVVLVDRTGHVLFIERDRWQVPAQGQPTRADPASQRVFRFRLQGCE